MRLLNSIFRLLHVNKKNWKAVVLCILAATIFWFLNSLNENYTSNVSFPLTFDYNTELYIPVEPLPERVIINVTGMGWDLFRRSAGFKMPPLVIPLERPSATRKLVGSTIPALISGQLENLHVNFVVNDTIYLNIEEKSRRRVGVGIDSIVQYIRPGYGLTSEVSLTPDSVWLEGPESMIREIPRRVNLQLDQKNIDDDFEEEVDVLPASEGLVTATPAVVFVRFKVEEFVEVTDSVRLVLLNIPESAQPSLQVDKLPVTLRIRQSQAADFDWDSISAVVDLKGFGRGNLRAEPDVEGLPRGAEVVEIDSVRITY